MSSPGSPQAGSERGAPRLPDRGERGAGPAPGRRRRRIHPLPMAALSVVALLMSLLVGMLIVSMARVHYYLPPPAEGADPVLQQDWNTYTLLWSLGPLVGALLAVAGLVIGIRGAIRGEDVPARGLWLALAALLMNLVAVLGAFVIDIPTGTY